MNLAGLSKIHESNLEVGKTYFYKNKHGSGYVKLLGESEDGFGWQVELQGGAGFNPHLKRYRAGEEMKVLVSEGTWYEPKE